MKLLHFLHIIKLSFYSKEFYRLVYQQWKHKCLSYWWWMTMLGVLPGMLLLWLVVYQFELPPTAEPMPPAQAMRLHTLVRYVIDQMPEITIRHGEAYGTQGKKTIDFPGTKEPVVVIDMPEDRLLPEESAALLVIKKKAFFLNISGAGAQAYPYDKLFANETVITPHHLEQWLSQVRKLLLWMIPLLLLPFSTFFSWVVGLMRALVFSQIYWYMGVRPADRPYTARLGLFRLAIVSATPALIIDLMLLFLGIYPYNLAIKLALGLLLPLGYFYFAVKSCKAGSKIS